MTGEDRSSAASVRRRHAILTARTRRLARPRMQVDPPPTIRCLICDVGGELYALPVTRVARVAPEAPTSFVPARSRALVGVAVVAGAIHHVINLQAVVGDGGERPDAPGHFVQLRGVGAPTALRVDRAHNVADLVKLGADEVSGLAPTHPAVTGFARVFNPGQAAGQAIGQPTERAIALIDPDQLAATSARLSEGD